jgi:hypothetical protein
MADDVLFIGWGQVVRGREQQALDVFQENVEFWGRCMQDGQIESFEPILLEPHGGELAGFSIVRGQRAQLDEIVRSDEYRRLMVRANAIVDDLGLVHGYGDEALGRQLEAFRETAGALA